MSIMFCIRSRLPVVIGAAALVTQLLGATLPASAQWHRDDVGAGIAAGAIGGLAAGAIAAGAANGGYAPGPAYDPGYGGDCYLQRQRVWDGYSWRIQRVRVCE